MSRATNETGKLIKAGTYRFVSLNESSVSDRFSRMVIKRMTDRGRATADEKHWTLGEMFDEFVRGKVNVYPEYQRGLVADPQWARELVGVCIMTSAPIAPVYLHAVEGGAYEVVDGAQRLAAYFMFMMGGYPIVDESGGEHWFCRPEDRSHWSCVLAADGRDGIASYVDDTPMHPNLTRFADQVRGTLRSQRQDDPILPAEDQGRFRGRKQSIVVMPGTWDRELSILYVVYTGLKAWRQTKDECLVHMHDRASRAVKPLERPLLDALAMAGLRLVTPTRQAYGVVLRTFAVIEGFAHVPVEQDERLYVDLMFELATRYADSPPCGETVAAVAKGVEWIANHGAAIARDLKTKNPVLHPDHLCVLLYAVGTRDGFQTRGVSALLGFVGRSKPKRAEFLDAMQVSNAAEILADYQDVLAKRRTGSINLADMCRVCARLVV
eukprot:jgi/Tetstr1/464076/TSEL_008881.t1